MTYILIGFTEMGCNGLDLIYLSKDGIQWQAHVNMGMNLQVFRGLLSSY
jgi:hypothetical protein